MVKPHLRGAMKSMIKHLGGVASVSGITSRHKGSSHLPHILAPLTNWNLTLAFPEVSIGRTLHVASHGLPLTTTVCVVFLESLKLLSSDDYIGYIYIYIYIHIYIYIYIS